MMRRFLIIITLLALIVNAKAQSVYYKCNINTINKQLKQTARTPLYEQGGYVLIPKSLCKWKETEGILICHAVFWDEYYAFDMLCPACKAEGRGNHKMYMENDIIVKCDRCYAEFQNISYGGGQQTNMMAKYALRTYIVYKRGNTLIVTDKIIPEYLGI